MSDIDMREIVSEFYRQASTGVLRMSMQTSMGIHNRRLIRAY